MRSKKAQRPRRAGRSAAEPAQSYSAAEREAAQATTVPAAQAGSAVLKAAASKLAGRARRWLPDGTSTKAFFQEQKKAAGGWFDL